MSRHGILELPAPGFKAVDEWTSDGPWEMHLTVWIWLSKSGAIDVETQVQREVLQTKTLTTKLAPEVTTHA